MSRFRMPAEWEPHEATWLSWPHERSDWPGKFSPVPHLYAEIVRWLSQGEEVRILIRSADVTSARRLCQRAGALLDRVSFIPTPTNRSWTRDTCPLFVRDAAGRIHAAKFRFNGWAKYDNWQEDDAAGELAGRTVRKRVHKPLLRNRRVVLEGGSIDVNGSGTLLTTEECLLSDVQQRNPGMTREDYEQVFDRFLGIDRVLWLNRGIAGDDTHGHVDDLARFVSDSTVVTAVESDRADDNYEILAENLRLLRKMVPKVVTLPMPKPVYYAGQRLPASYANFYIANRTVLVPTFHDPNDRIALNTLANLFPTRTIVGIHSVDLVLGLGTLHCMTMQQPL